MTDRDDSNHGSLLGQTVTYVTQYAPELLEPIARERSRQPLALDGDLPFSGVDLWTAYELSWLNPRGKPVVAIGEFAVPATSPNIIESKSFKLYLNSLNQTVYESREQVAKVLQRDLSAAAKAPVSVLLQGVDAGAPFSDFDAECLDDLDVSIEHYTPDPELLQVDVSERVEESLCSHLLRSNCPVTGQPDWASVWIQYSGAKIVRENLLRYLVSFREHQDFHEHCVERMFVDLKRVCQPEKLSVYARYTRRGGLDINPFRSDWQSEPPPVRLRRQ